MSRPGPEILVRGRFARPVDRAAVARAWAERGFSCDLFVDPPGRVWRDFVHPVNELICVLEGRLEVTVGDRVVVAEPGDEVFIPRHTRHSVRNLNAGDSLWLYGYD